MPGMPDPHDESPLLPEEWLDLVDETSRAPARQPSVEGDGQDAGRFEALARARVQARALRSLPGRAAPSELDGLVVAALHGGHREHRAAAYVASLEERPAPSALRPRAEALIDRSARSGSVRGPVSREARHVAPAELDRLVAARVRAESDGGPEPIGAAQRRVLLRESARQRLVSATAAGVVLGLLFGVVGVIWSLSGDSAVTNTGAGSEIETADGSFVEFIQVDVRDLSPSDRALLSRLGGPLMGGKS